MFRIIVSTGVWSALQNGIISVWFFWKLDFCFQKKITIKTNEVLKVKKTFIKKRSLTNRKFEILVLYKFLERKKFSNEKTRSLIIAFQLIELDQIKKESEIQNDHPSIRFKSGSTELATQFARFRNLTDHGYGDRQSRLTAQWTILVDQRALFFNSSTCH